MRDWLRGHSRSSSVWWLFRLWECPCGERNRSRYVHIHHELTCRDVRAYNGQGVE